MRKYITLLSIILVACSSEKKDNAHFAIFPIDTIKHNSELQLDNEITSILKILNEKSISIEDTMAHEFRCYYFPPFRENNIFFKINYIDSILTTKEFTNKYPDGSGSDSLLKTKKIHLDIDDFKTIDQLVTKSMFWSLENYVYPYISIDGQTFIYECRQPMSNKIVEIRKKYSAVKGVSTKNHDFINLGQFFLFRAGYKNSYEK